MGLAEVIKPGVDQFLAEDWTYLEVLRELGLHHPRSSSSKFVTVSYDVFVADVSAEDRNAREFLASLLDVVA